MPPGSIVQLTSTPNAATANLVPGGLGPKVASDANGNFHTSIVIPLATPVGSYTIGVLCGPVTVPTNEILNVTAATHPPSITVSPTSTPRGGAVTIAGVVPTTGASLCPRADTAQLTSTLFPSGLGPQVTRSATGAFTTSYTVPATATVGSYSIGIRCGGGNVGVSATLQVTAGTATTTTVPSTTTTTTTTVTTTTVSPATTLAPLTDGADGFDHADHCSGKRQQDQEQRSNAALGGAGGVRAGRRGRGRRDHRQAGSITRS